MRWISSTLALALSLPGCSKGTPEEVTPDPAPTTSTTVVAPRNLGPRSGLTLEAKLTKPGPFEVGGEGPELKAELINGAEASVPVVQLADGSSQPRWREPYVFYTVERFTMDGTWERVSPGDTGRCGMHDADWSDEVMAVAPGKRLDLDLGWAPFRHDLQAAGPHRVRVHYRFQGEHPKQSPPVSTTKMAGESAYELVSEPITFEVVRPLDVRLEAVAPLEAGRATPIDRVLRVEVHNQSPKERELPTPSAGNTRFEVVGEETHLSLPYAEGKVPTHALASDAKAIVLGPKSVLPRPAEKAWTVAKAGKYLVRVSYLGVTSNWAEVTAK